MILLAVLNVGNNRILGSGRTYVYSSGNALETVVDNAYHVAAACGQILISQIQLSAVNICAVLDLQVVSTQQTVRIQSSGRGRHGYYDVLIISCDEVFHR